MSRNQKIIFSFIILFVGIFIFASEYFNSKRIEAYDYINEVYYSEVVSIDSEVEEVDEIVNVEENNEEESVEDNSNSNNYEFTNIDSDMVYVGYLSIPNINLKKGFTEKTSKYNTVSRNIQILSASDYPDKDKGNVIIAAHSGNSSVSYFNKLYLLNKGDLAYIDYNNVKYTYKIVEIYTIPKTGKAEIKRNKNVSTLTLITCTKDDKTTQTIYVSELISQE